MSENGNSLLSPDALPGDTTTKPEQPSAFKRIFTGPNGIRAGWRILIFILVVFALGQTLRLVWPSAPPLKNPQGEYVLEPVGATISRLRTFLVLVVASLVMAWMERERWRDYGLPIRRIFSRDSLIGLVWGFVALSLVMFGLWMTGAYRIESLALAGPAIWKFAALWGAMFVMVGLLEEFLFRGYLQYALASGIGFWPTSVITSALFVLSHGGNPGENWMGFADIFVTGMFLCLSLWRTGDLWFAVWFHTVWDWGLTYFYSAPNSGTNAVGQLFHVRLQGPAWLSGGSAGPEGSIINLGVDLLYFVVFLAIYRQRKWIGMPERRRAVADVSAEPVINPQALEQ